ncbi:MAG: hypothetical protein IKT46_09470 [Clostridia bacterium]|nr:hypothetical protein [Clostridia bacterium]
MNKFLALFAILMVMTMLFTAVAVPVFADGSLPGEEAKEEIVENTEPKETTDSSWAGFGDSVWDYVAIVVAVVLLVAFVVAIVLFVPKKTKQR